MSKLNGYGFKLGVFWLILELQRVEQLDLNELCLCYMEQKEDL